NWILVKAHPVTGRKFHRHRIFTPSSWVEHKMLDGNCFGDNWVEPCQLSSACGFAMQTHELQMYQTRRGLQFSTGSSFPKRDWKNSSWNFQKTIDLVWTVHTNNACNGRQPFSN